jgi:hypothetical protein
MTLERSPGLHPLRALDTRFVPEAGDRTNAERNILHGALAMSSPFVVRVHEEPPIRNHQPIRVQQAELRFDVS